jgi:hypothetical protein
VILIVVGGASVVSGALLGGFLFQLPIFLVDRLSTVEVSLPLLGTFKPFVIWNRIATGLLGIALGRQPEGIVPEVSSELEEKRRHRKGRAPTTTPDDGEPPSAPEPAPVEPVPAPGG